jgi:hypothetical protein
VRVSPYEGGACTDDSVTGAQEKGGGVSLIQDEKILGLDFGVRPPCLVKLRRGKCNEYGSRVVLVHFLDT